MPCFGVWDDAGADALVEGGETAPMVNGER